MKEILILIIILLPLSSFARKPAVEPVTGISIDDYKDVPPSEAQGYDWNQKTKKTQGPRDSQSKLDVEKLPTQEIDNSFAPDLTPAFVLFFMLVLPFAIWFSLIGKLDAPENEIGFIDEDLDNTLAFPTKSQKNESDKNADDDDFNVPKAS